MPYKIELSKRAGRQLKGLSREVQVRIGRAIDGLAQTPVPQNARKLVGLEDLYRIRVGDYRVVYTIQHEVLLVLVVAVGHRREIYDRLP